MGAGLAGLEFATAVRDYSGRTLIVEAGPDNGMHHKDAARVGSPNPTWQNTSLDPDFRRRALSSHGVHYADAFGIRERVGGRSLYWHGVCLPIERPALIDPKWPHEVVAQLSANSQSPGSYRETLDRLSAWRGADISAVRGAREESLIMHLRDKGYSAEAVPQAARQEVMNSSIAQIPYVPPLNAVLNSKKSQIQLLSGFRVIDIKPDRRGISLNGYREGVAASLRADRVVLACGAIENTRLIGQILADARASDAITFTGLNDHVVVGYVLDAPAGRLPLPNLHERAFVYASDYRPSCNLFIDIRPERDGRIRATVWAMGEIQGPTDCVTVMRAELDEEVRVTSNAEPERSRGFAIQLDALGSSIERVFGLAREELNLASIRFDAGRPSYLDALTKISNLRTDGSRAEPYCYPLGAVDHEGGTLPLGGILDIHGRLPELPSLSVLGPVTFPRSGIANPSLTTLSLARQHARLWT